MRTATIALGGNALIRKEDRGTAEDQFDRMRKTCEKLAEMISDGFDLVLTHGNGPQVGNILLQNEIASDTVPPLPLDICGAESQGQIGYMFQQTLRNQLSKKGVDRNVVSFISQVIVDKDDPAFENPSKFVGPSYSESEIEKIRKEKDWMIKQTAEGEYRRVVPSPRPKEIVEDEVIEELIFSEKSRNVVIAAGGGGVPVIEEDGSLKGIEGVIDKDRASAVLAADIDETFLIMLTDIERAYLNYGEENEEPLDIMSVREAKKYLEEGHFPPGSMGPKIEASIHFLESGGEKVLITTPEALLPASEEGPGTYIYPE